MNVFALECITEVYSRAYAASTRRSNDIEGAETTARAAVNDYIEMMKRLAPNSFSHVPEGYVL